MEALAFTLSHTTWQNLLIRLKLQMLLLPEVAASPLRGALRGARGGGGEVEGGEAEPLGSQGCRGAGLTQGEPGRGFFLILEPGLPVRFSATRNRIDSKMKCSLLSKNCAF